MVSWFRFGFGRVGFFGSGFVFKFGVGGFCRFGTGTRNLVFLFRFWVKLVIFFVILAIFQVFKEIQFIINII